MYRIILVFFLIIYLDSSRASPGGLDTSFGINGLTSVAIGDNAFATSLYLSENSEILVGGVAYPNSRWAVAKVNSTGQPVVSFGTGGTKTFQFSLLGGGVSALAHQGLSEILLGSDTGFGNSLIRINQFGEQDLTFGIEGRAMINFADAQNPIATGIVVLSSAKILVSGYVRTSDSETQGFILRLLPNGTVDSSFGSSGRILFNISGYRETLVVDFKENPTQSNYFLAGTACRDGPYCKQFIAKFNSNGQLDLDFGLSGFAYLSPEEYSNTFFSGVALQNDGKIVASGYIGNGGFGTKGFLSRFTSQGALDNSFGVSGITTPIVGATSSIFNRLEIDGGHGILVTGQVDSSAGLLVRFNQNGVADNFFGQMGQVRFPSVGGAAIKIQSDGKILVAGTRASKSGNYEFQVARFFGAPINAPVGMMNPVPMLGIREILLITMALILVAFFNGNLRRD